MVDFPQGRLWGMMLKMHMLRLFRSQSCTQACSSWADWSQLRWLIMITVVSCPRSYAQMTEDEIKLDRYSKFRSLGRFEEFPVIGGQWQQARAEREQARATPRGVHFLDCTSWHLRCLCRAAAVSCA